MIQWTIQNFLFIVTFHLLFIMIYLQLHHIERIVWKSFKNLEPN